MTPKQFLRECMKNNIYKVEEGVCGDLAIICCYSPKYQKTVICDFDGFRVPKDKKFDLYIQFNSIAKGKEYIDILLR